MSMIDLRVINTLTASVAHALNLDPRPYGAFRPAFRCRIFAP
jgi:hypothetical protein